MLNARFAPIERWPGTPTPTHKRIRTPFRAAYSKTLDKLEHELNRIHAQHITIEAYFRREQIRNDGWPLSRALPSEPGVIVSFTGKTGELSFPCDRYKSWEDNLRAIALALQALRAVDRYGVTQHAEQYKGWAKLPPAQETMQLQTACDFIGIHSGMYISEKNGAEMLKQAYKRAAAKLHPDNPTTGSHAQFVLLQKAEEAVRKAYGW